MILDIGPRRCGKTKAMIEWMNADEGRLLIVADDDAWRGLAIRYRDLGNRIMTWQAYWSRRPVFHRDGTCITEIGIDDADSVLQRLTFQPIGRMSMQASSNMVTAKL